MLLVILTLVLILTLSVTALAADGAEGLGYGFNATGLPIVDDEITVRVLYDRNTRHGDFDNFWFIDYVAEKTGIRLEFELVEGSAWNENVSLAFAGDTYPDVFMHNLSREQIATYSAEGYLVDLSDLIRTYVPNTVALYNQYPELVREITGDNGEIYFMPSINASPRDMITQYPTFINSQWLKNLGLEMPTALKGLPLNTTPTTTRGFCPPMWIPSPRLAEPASTSRCFLPAGRWIPISRSSRRARHMMSFPTRISSSMTDCS